MNFVIFPLNNEHKRYHTIYVSKAFYIANK